MPRVFLLQTAGFERSWSHQLRWQKKAETSQRIGANLCAKHHKAMTIHLSYANGKTSRQATNKADKNVNSTAYYRYFVQPVCYRIQFEVDIRNAYFHEKSQERPVSITEAIQPVASIMTTRGITMRLTVLDDNPGIKINPGRERITVYLDDAEVRRCLTADDEKGEVIVIATTSDGQPIVEHGALVHKTLHGKVRIERHGGYLATGNQNAVVGEALYQDTHIVLPNHTTRA